MAARFHFSREYQERSIEALTLGLETAPAYRSWQALDPGEAFPPDERYAALPVLTKKDLREHFPQGLVPNGRSVDEGLRRREIEWVQTSGTFNESVTNLWNQAWWNASEEASWRLNAHTAFLDRTQREAQLASALSVGFLSEDDLPTSARVLGRFLFLNEKASPGEWRERHYARMAQELEECRPALLEANPSYLARLAWWASAQGRRFREPQVVVFTYELPSAMQLRAIRNVFRAPLASSYGSTEAGYVFMQCEHGTFHQNTQFCRVDFQPLRPEHGGPNLGRILVTTFRNPWTSLIRFDVGDLVRLDERPMCPCGRNEGFRLSAVEGRLENATFTTQGRLVTTKATDDALAAVAGLRDYQLTQRSPREYQVRVVAEGTGDRAPAEAMRALQALYGPEASVTVERVEDIEPSRSGKFVRTRAELEKDEKSLFP